MRPMSLCNSANVARETPCTPALYPHPETDRATTSEGLYILAATTAAALLLLSSLL